MTAQTLEVTVDIRAGCLLIASPTLRDPNFARTVVLLCEHGDQGSMGLVVNRPTRHSVAEAIPGMPARATQCLYWGGPVQQQLVLVLHRRALEAPGGQEIGDGMALGTDADALAQILTSAQNPEEHVRVFSGYAGWGAGQLEAEMAERSWIVGPGLARLVLAAETETLWAEALEQLGPRYAYLRNVPLDPRVN